MKKAPAFFLLFFCLQLTAYSQSSYLTAFKPDYEGGPSTAVASGNKLYFSAPDSVHGRELWVTDGTKNGTHIVKDIYPGTFNGVSINFAYSAYDMNGILYFKANNGVNGPEFWRSDGTKTGTWMVKDIYAGKSDYGLGSFASIDTILYFTVNGTALWRSDGTGAGTYGVRSFSIIRDLCAFKGNLYFSASPDNTGEELWKSNGTFSGTKLLKNLDGTIYASLPINFHATSNALYFTATTAAGWELWKTTGTAESTIMVKDINPNGNGVMTHYEDVTISNIGNTVYFRATDGVSAFQLWKSDGTDAGTVKVSNLADGVSEYCTFPVVKGKVLFNSYNSSAYWQYDPASDVVSPTAYPFYAYFERNEGRNTVFAGSHLYYLGEDSLYGSEVWRSDGTALTTHRIQETHLVNNFFVIYSNGFNTLLGIANGKLFFTLARRPYDTDMPVFTCDTAVNSTFFPPSLIVPVPLSTTLMHLVWNRIENASQYEVRYRIATSTDWQTRIVTSSYTSFTQLTPTANYRFQVRAFCNGAWTTWSENIDYLPSALFHDYVINILADRAENDSTMRIYWLKTPEIEKTQLRYRVAGTTTWESVQNINGYIRLQHLIAGAFYEYQYRPYIGGTWGDWYPAYLHFMMPYSLQSKTISERNSSPQLLLYPNPAADVVHVQSSIPANTSFTITDGSGIILRTGVLQGKVINLSGLHAGLLTITIQKGEFKQSGNVLKE